MSEDYNKLLEIWREEKKRRQLAEGELSIIKGIGNNSPEMKAYELENKRLKEDLERLAEENTNYEVISRTHKKLNGELRQVIKEVKEDNKKQAQQVSDLEDKIKNIEQNYIRIDGKR